MDNVRSSFLKGLQVDTVSSLDSQNPMKKKPNGSNNGGTSAKQGMPDISSGMDDR